MKHLIIFFAAIGIATAIYMLANLISPSLSLEDNLRREDFRNGWYHCQNTMLKDINAAKGGRVKTWTGIESDSINFEQLFIGK